MAVKPNTKAKKAEKKEEKKETYKEFKFDGQTFSYSGRIYPTRGAAGKILNSWGLTLTLNDSITVKGCRLVETENNIFITWPQYQNKDNKYISYFYIAESLNEELDKLIQQLYNLVAETSEEVPF